MRRKNVIAALMPLLFAGLAAGGEFDSGTGSSYADQPLLLDSAPPTQKAIAPPAAPPLPVHTIEGYGGGSITPTAYLVNAGPAGDFFGLPSVSATGVFMGHGKSLVTAGIAETLFGRLELGYGAGRFGIGDTQDDIEDATGIQVSDDVYLHNLNARFLLLPENSFKTTFLPAITVGSHFKINDGIEGINDDLDGALSGIGYDRNYGWDFTLTASKTIPNVFGRPLIVSAGLRNSEAAWTGYLGFGDDRHTTFEGNLIYVATDWLTIGYE